MKDYIGCLIPIVIVLAIGTLIAVHNKRVEQREDGIAEGRAETSTHLRS